MKRLIVLAAAAGVVMLAGCTNLKNERRMETLNLTHEWDKTFPESEKVTHSKIIFRNRYGIELAADLYKPVQAEIGRAHV